MTQKERVLWYVEKLDKSEGETDLLFYAEALLGLLLVYGPTKFGYRGTKKKTQGEKGA
ncbi:MAG: hypothetical protein IKN04_17230 [Clostridia bacterium]|nr:hypothetical protein [Clostridia bacterium]